MITTLYAGALGLLMAGLALHVPLLRAKHNVSLGDGGVAALTLSARRFGNFIEYVPMALLLMFLLENQGASATVLHGLGGVLLAARLAHAVCLYDAGTTPTWKKAGRALGALATFVVIATASVFLLAPHVL